MIIVFVSVLAGCFNDGRGDKKISDAPAQELIGILINSPVSGAAYDTRGESGLTEVGGKFSYVDGNNVTFSVGTISLGTVMGAEIITPVELTGSPLPTTQAAVNMLVFLQSIDADSPN